MVMVSRDLLMLSRSLLALFLGVVPADVKSESEILNEIERG